MPPAAKKKGKALVSDPSQMTAADFFQGLREMITLRMILWAAAITMGQIGMMRWLSGN